MASKIGTISRSPSSSQDANDIGEIVGGAQVAELFEIYHMLRKVMCL